MILPGTGRGTAAAGGGGGVRASDPDLPGTLGITCPYPSTMLRMVPLPMLGRN